MPLVAPFLDAAVFPLERSARILFTRRFLSSAIAAAALALGLCRFASAETSVILPGHIPRRILAATKLERVPADERVDLSLVVNIDQALLDRTLAQLYGSKPGGYKRFLGRGEFARLFDIEDKRQKLKEFAVAAGLSVDAARDKPGSLIVRVYGPSSRVETALGVELHHYRSADGQVFRANDANPSIPESLAPHLSAVLGLSSFRGAHKPHFVRRRPDADRSGSAGRPSSLSGGTGPGGGLAPANIKAIYGLNGASNGSGQTVALYELDGYAPSDITLYEQNLFPVPHPNPTVSCLSEDGSCFECGTNQNLACDSTTLGNGGTSGDGGMIEVALDIELAIALAPDAQILVYTAQNTDADSLAAYAKIASDDTASVISTSWGEDEEDIGSAAMGSENTIFEQMATQGQSIFSAAGDAGAYDASGVPHDSSSEQKTLLTDDPASQPFVTGVGGTSLSGTIGSSPTETVWNEGCTGGNPGFDCSKNGAGGGGVAYYDGDWAIPDYQSGVAGSSSTVFRNVPDVTLNADPDTSPYSICVGGSCSNCGSDSDCTTLIGGTSAATPLWAALTALVNQQRVGGGGSTLGFANPPLYELGTGASYHSVFNDITSGNNGFYSAGAGYDDASGWGSFQGNALIDALVVPSTVTAASPEFTDVGADSITVNWSALGELLGTVYTAQISTNDFGTVNATSVTRNAFAFFGTGGAGAALVAATTYYFRVQASSGSDTSSVSSLGQTDTLAIPPMAPGLLQVWTSSLTMHWTANGNPAGTSYRVDFWQAVGSTTSVFTTSTAPALTGLAEGATYFITVGALNGLSQLAPSGVILSTVTIAQPSSTSVVPSTGGTVSIHPPSGLVTLQIPAGAIGQSDAVTLALPSSFPSAPASAGSLVGTGVGIQIVSDVEPLTNTLLTVSYPPSAAAGLNPSEFVLARYDPVDGVWVPLVSTVDASNGTVAGVTSHWSLFQVMQNAPSQSPSSAKAFPNPWRVPQGPASMTFTFLPAGARLRIYTLTGRVVKDFSADASGMAGWDGTNESGRPAASGFYFLYIEGAGQSATLKLALQR
jgi:kumamolisin